MQRNYEPNADRIIALYQQLEEDILSAIVRRMLKMGYVSDATKHQIEVLQTAGLLYDDIIQLIADRTDASTAQVKALFEDAGVQTVSIDNDIYEKSGEIPVEIRQDDSMKQVLEAGYKKTLSTMQNLVRTTANNAQTAFIQMCDRIYMQVASGAFSYQEAIRFALRELADTGAYITYPTGHTDRLDVAVRRCVLTGVSQTAAAVAKQQAENADCQYMELTAHSGARPEHAKWQGQLVIIKGKRTKLYIDGLKVFTLSEIGYGDGAGFKGWNCRHNWHPYYVGYSTPNYTQEELKKLDEPCIPYNGTLYTEYEISQMQRAGERKVRAWKRRCITAQEGVNSAADDVTKAAAQAEYSKSAVHLKANEEKLKDFCKQTGQDRDRFREQVYGFGRSEAQRAVQAAKKAKSSLTSGAKSGILNDIESDIEVHTKYFNQKLKYYDITPERIQSIPEIKMDGLTEKENAAITNSCKDLLKYMQDSEVGTEGVLVLDKKFKEIDRYKGVSGKPKVPLKRYNQPYIALHNHPDGLPFSEKDIQQFIQRDNMIGLVAIGNDGTPYFIYKESDYNIDIFDEYVNDIRMNHLIEMTAEDHIRFSEEVLANATENGVAVFNGKDKKTN